MTGSENSTLKYWLEEFAQHQRRTRGLRDRTLQGYEHIVEILIRDRLGEDPIAVDALRPVDVVEFVRTMSHRYSPHSMKNVRTALRSFFRYLQSEGLCDATLAVAIPKGPVWRRRNLPKRLTDEQLCAVLESFQNTSPCGRRDRAIVQLLAILGLRPGELAALLLEDIDWCRGNIHLRTRKTRRGATLPLPRHAGQAVADYLRHERPKTPERHVFVQHLGRRRGMPISSGIVSAAVYRAIKRAGVEAPMDGAYVFRHTVASQMVARGTRLKEVADVLGHQCLDTTTIYARLDVSALLEVALPWPEVTS